MGDLNMLNFNEDPKELKNILPESKNVWDENIFSGGIPSSNQFKSQRIGIKILTSSYF